MPSPNARLYTLDHCTYTCQYHLVWITKYRGQVLADTYIKAELKRIFKQLARWKGFTILQSVYHHPTQVLRRLCHPDSEREILRLAQKKDQKAASRSALVQRLLCFHHRYQRTPDQKLHQKPRHQTTTPSTTSAWPPVGGRTKPPALQPAVVHFFFSAEI